MTNLCAYLDIGCYMKEVMKSKDADTVEPQHSCLDCQRRVHNMCCQYYNFGTTMEDPEQHYCCEKHMPEGLVQRRVGIKEWYSPLFDHRKLNIFE